MRKIREIFSSNYSLNGIVLQTLRHYKSYRKTYRILKKSQSWSKEQIDQYQLHQLKKLLYQAYENVPYYTKVFDKLDIKPKDIKSIQDLQKLPYLSRDIIKENMEELKAKNYPKNKFELSWTGGSTGQPLHFFIEKGVWMSQLTAYSKILMEWAGCSHFNRYVFITGNDTPLKYQLFGRVLVLSSFHMNNEYLPLFIKKIRILKPKYIQGYPSAITILANYLKRNKKYNSQPKVRKRLNEYAKKYYNAKKNKK